LEKVAGKRVIGQAGEIDDGWGRLLETLQGFPYEFYGIPTAEKEKLKPQ